MSSHFGFVIVAAALPLLMHAGGASAQSVTAEEQNTIVTMHNAYRALHCAPPLTWSAELAASAQQWANKCGMTHGPHGRFGENLAWGTNRTASSAVHDWYLEVGKYNYGKPGFAHGIGHFTQMIWKNSKQIGCGVTRCNGRVGRLWVCRYTPAGNWVGQFRQNVLKRCK
jgi:uncharacterized protein YkwD